jgi:hypothetical protein
MKKLYIILNVLLIIFLSISIYFNINNNKNEKYLINYFENEYYNDLIIIDKDNNKKVIQLGYNNNNEIVEVYLEEHKGFSFRIGRMDNKIIHYVITDENFMYQNITNFYQTENMLIDRQEQYHIFSKHYKLLNDGNIEILHWNIANKE